MQIEINNCYIAELSALTEIALATVNTMERTLDTLGSHGDTIGVQMVEYKLRELYARTEALMKKQCLLPTALVE